MFLSIADSFQSPENLAERELQPPWSPFSKGDIVKFPLEKGDTAKSPLIKGDLGGCLHHYKYNVNGYKKTIDKSFCFF